MISAAGFERALVAEFLKTPFPVVGLDEGGDGRGQFVAVVLVISTAVGKVCLDFGQPTQRGLDALTVADAKRYAAEGQFARGAMLPKVEACVHFIEQGGSEAVITCPETLSAALDGRTGARVTA